MMNMENAKRNTSKFFLVYWQVYTYNTRLDFLLWEIIEET
jgi:hypothetical protein